MLGLKRLFTKPHCSPFRSLCNNVKSNIAIVGCGAIGMFYGLRLLQDELHLKKNYNVSFLMRGDFETVNKCGAELKYDNNIQLFQPEDFNGRIFSNSKILFQEKGAMDWVIVCVKSYSINEEFYKSVLLPLHNNTTKYLIIMNGIGIEDKFIRWFGADNIYGALSFAAVYRINSNKILSDSNINVQHKLQIHCILDGRLEVGHVIDSHSLNEVSSLLSPTLQQKLILSHCLLSSRWHKLCWNMTFSGLSVAMGGITSDVIIKDASLQDILKRMIEEIVLIANRDIRTHYTGDKSIDLVLLDANKILTILANTANANSKPYKMSLLVDLMEGRPLELDSLFYNPIERAKKLQCKYEEYATLQTIISMVSSMSRLVQDKKSRGVSWYPTCINE